MTKLHDWTPRNGPVLPGLLCELGTGLLGMHRAARFLLATPDFMFPAERDPSRLPAKDRRFREIDYLVRIVAATKGCRRTQNSLEDAYAKIYRLGMKLPVSEEIRVHFREGSYVFRTLPEIIHLLIYRDDRWGWSDQWGNWCPPGMGS
jgi:hypothetical protein